ncbi:MAG TPA: hypothetical protein VKW78_18245 [Terriglobales bacterium]|nr:hypothetical protein [Terriglobales bacterium]
MRDNVLRRGTLLLCLALASTFSVAQSVKDSHHLTPTGKGWGENNPNIPDAQKARSVITGNRINYHGGPVMLNKVNAYFIWYGNWGAGGSNSSETITLLNDLYSSGGLNNSGYERINSTYGSNSGNVSGSVELAATAYDNYSHGTRLSDSAVEAVVANAINSNKLPKDANGIYFVLTSSDVNETSGFCTQYCGWHTHGRIAGSDIKYSFVGNPDRCPSACEAETSSPNGDSGADGMASIMAHETEEAISDPDLNAWYDSSGAENADKCAWMFGPTTGSVGSGGYNQTLAGHHWLIQMNWENSRGGGCDQTKGGAFYNF